MRTNRPNIEVRAWSTCELIAPWAGHVGACWSTEMITLGPKRTMVDHCQTTPTQKRGNLLILDTGPADPPALYVPWSAGKIGAIFGISMSKACNQHVFLQLHLSELPDNFQTKQRPILAVASRSAHSTSVLVRELPPQWPKASGNRVFARRKHEIQRSTCLDGWYEIRNGSKDLWIHCMQAKTLDPFLGIWWLFDHFVSCKPWPLMLFLGHAFWPLTTSRENSSQLCTAELNEIRQFTVQTSRLRNYI